MKRLLILAVMILAGLAGVNRLRAQNAPHEAGYLYLSPVPSASYVSAQTRYVLVRFTGATPSEVTNLTTSFIQVSGASTGPRSGVTHVASDGRTVIFEMGAGFSANELVTVTLNPLPPPGAGASVQPYQYQFMTTAPMPGFLPLSVAPAKPSAPTPGAPEKARPLVRKSAIAKTNSGKRVALISNGVSVPSDFPQVVITANTNPSPGYLFLENALDGVPAYTMMLDNNGFPVWYRRGRMFDFKVQKDGTMSWGTYDSSGSLIFTVTDQNFNYLKTCVATNGYLTDAHELKVLADGTYFLIGDQYSTVDLSQIVEGGSTAASVMESVVQGFTAAGELIFQWRPWDNYDIRDLPAGYNSDFPHMNAIDIDEDGNIVVSARHLSEVTKINRDSGEIIWRLGGAHSGFDLGNDPLNGTSFQHSISALGSSHYMVFDNGNYHVPEVSRAVEYQLDLTNMTATMVWQFRDNPDKYTYYTGNAQRLPSGNTLIDFALAQYPKAIEVDTNGLKRFELSLVPESDSYRAFRFPWNGAVAAPYLIAEQEAGDIALIFNKFGDTNVGYYRIYGGTSPHPTSRLAESGTTFERLSNLQNGLYYFRVTALSTDGVESPFSNEEAVQVNFTKPGQNMIVNGDFSQGNNAWTLNVSGGASAGWAVENGAGHFYITNSGEATSSIQLVQPGKGLIQGNQYVLQFDAWSSESRYLDVELAQTTAPFNKYSSIPAPFLTPNRTHYRYVFTMQLASDFAANLLFNLGTSSAEVYLDNISLFTPPVGDLNLDGHVDLLDLGIFGSNWLKQQTGLPADLDGNGKVDFNDFGILGGDWAAGGP